MTDKYGRKATPEEVMDEINNISPAGLLKLRAFALPLIAGTGYRQPEDLVQDAIRAALDGSRSWRIGLSFDKFLCGVMKSMASNDRTRGRGKCVRPMDIGENEGADTLENAVPPVKKQLIDDEHERARRRFLEQLRKFFENDPQVLAILEGKLNGLTPAEIQANEGMTPTE